jgi:hypothetical protein
MLKIKDDVNLIKLRGFGFVPRYDEETGKIKKYIFLKNKCIECIIEYRELIYTNYYGFKSHVKGWMIDDCVNIDALYDLIQSGLVEKVGE